MSSYSSLTCLAGARTALLLLLSSLADRSSMPRGNLLTGSPQFARLHSCCGRKSSLLTLCSAPWNRNQVASLPVKSPAPSPMRARWGSLLFAPSYSHRRLLTTGLQQVLSLLFDLDQPTLPPIVNLHACLRLSPSGIHFDVLSSPVLYTTYLPFPLLDPRVVSVS